MAFKLAGIAPALRAAGLTVVELPGWKTRTRPGSHAPKGFLAHHTAGTSDSQAYVEWMTYEGRASEGIPGPLCQIALSRKGIVYLCAAGRANHAGKCRAVSNWLSAGDGNTQMVGCEALHRGGTEPWTATQYNAYVRLAAVTADFMGWPRSHTLGHKETSLTGKVDPTFNMSTFRTNVAQLNISSTPTPTEEDDFDMRTDAQIQQLVANGLAQGLSGSSQIRGALIDILWNEATVRRGYEEDGITRKYISAIQELADAKSLGQEILAAVVGADLQAAVSAAVTAALAGVNLGLGEAQLAALGDAVAGKVNDTIQHAVNIVVTQE